MGRYLTVAALALSLLLSSTGIVLITADSKSAPAPRANSDLAERINHACPPGYKVTDWTTGDEFDPVPEGTIQVTCSNPEFDLRYVAIPYQTSTTP